MADGSSTVRQVGSLVTWVMWYKKCVYLLYIPLEIDKLQCA